MLLCHDLLHVHGVVTSLGPEPGLGITSVPAPLSPGSKQAIGDFVLVPLLCAEDNPSLGCCLMAMVDKTFGLGFPTVYPCFLLWAGLIEPVSAVSSQDGCF